MKNKPYLTDVGKNEESKQFLKNEQLAECI